MDEDPFPEDDERLAAEYDAIGHLLSIDRSDLAEARLRRLLRDDPDERYTHYLLASALRALGRPAEAEAACREALRISPNDSAGHALLGFCDMATHWFTLPAYFLFLIGLRVVRLWKPLLAGAAVIFLLLVLSPLTKAAAFGWFAGWDALFIYAD